MLATRNSTDLVNNFDDIQPFCRNHREPVFLTNNGRGELVVLSMEMYKELSGRVELYRALQMGQGQISNGDIIEEEKMMAKLSGYIERQSCIGGYYGLDVWPFAKLR